MSESESDRGARSYANLRAYFLSESLLRSPMNCLSSAYSVRFSWSLGPA